MFLVFSTARYSHSVATEGKGTGRVTVLPVRVRSVRYLILKDKVRTAHSESTRGRAQNSSRSEGLFQPRKVYFGDVLTSSICHLARKSVRSVARGQCAAPLLAPYHPAPNGTHTVQHSMMSRDGFGPTQRSRPFKISKEQDFYATM